MCNRTDCAGTWAGAMACAVCREMDMSMMESTVKCPICGKPYKTYPMYCGDQSACPECRAAAERAVNRPSTPIEEARRERHFGGWYKWN